MTVKKTLLIILLIDVRTNCMNIFISIFINILNIILIDVTLTANKM